MKRTKKSIMAGILVIIFGLIIYPSLCWETAKTVEEAIEKSGRDIAKIIYEEKLDDGAVVFFYKEINGGKDHTLAAGFLKKAFRGWKWIYGGEHSEPSQMITAQYFPYTGDAAPETPFPLAFGEITNPEIVKIELQTENWEVQKEARVVENEGTRIWYLFLSPSEGNVTKVIGYAKSGEVIDSRDLGENPTVTKIES